MAQNFSRPVKIGNRQVDLLDLVVVGAGVVVLVLSFLHWFSYSAGGFSAGVSAWHAGFWGYFGVQFAVIAAIVAAVGEFTTFQVYTRPVAVTRRVAVLALAALGALCILIKLLIGVDHLGRDVALYLALVVALVETASAYLAVTARGERLGLLRQN
jgi:hypothetical protein